MVLSKKKNVKSRKTRNSRKTKINKMKGGGYIDKIIRELKSESTFDMDFTDKQIDINGANKLNLALSTNKKVTDLRVSNINDIKYAKIIISALSEALKTNSTIVELSLFKITLDKAAILILKEGLQQNTNLKTLIFYETNMGHEGAQAIAEVLNSSNLTYLDIGNNNIGDEGAKEIAKVLNSSNLTYLSINTNNIGVEGAQAIAVALKDNKQLNELYLYGNNIGDEGAKAIAEALADNTRLKELIIYDSHIGNEGGIAFLQAFEKNTTLQHLDIRNNHINNKIMNQIKEKIPRLNYDIPIEIPKSDLQIKNLKSSLSILNLNDVA